MDLSILIVALTVNFILMLCITGILYNQAESLHIDILIKLEDLENKLDR